MIFAFLFAAVAQLSAADAVHTACYEQAHSQLVLTMCVGEAYERADAELNRLWSEIIVDARAHDRSPDNGHTDSDQRNLEEILNRAQHAWIQFRDAQCEYEGLSERGGSLEPMIVNDYMARLTGARIDQLSPDER